MLKSCKQLKTLIKLLKKKEKLPRGKGRGKGAVETFVQKAPKMDQGGKGHSESVWPRVEVMGPLKRSFKGSKRSIRNWSRKWVLEKLRVRNGRGNGVLENYAFEMFKEMGP